MGMTDLNELAHGIHERRETRKNQPMNLGPLVCPEIQCGHGTVHKGIVLEMTHNAMSGTLNPTTTNTKEG